MNRPIWSCMNSNGMRTEILRSFAYPLKKNQKTKFCYRRLVYSIYRFRFVESSWLASCLYINRLQLFSVIFAAMLFWFVCTAIGTIIVKIRYSSTNYWIYCATNEIAAFPFICNLVCLRVFISVIFIGHWFFATSCEVFFMYWLEKYLTLLKNI